MKASWEKIEKNLGVLTVEVESEKVNQAIDKAFKKVVAKVAVPGFRKGKVPRSIFEKRYGVESLYNDAMDFILQDSYVEAVEETGIEPIDRPDVDIQQFAKDQEFKFTAKVQVKPEVTLGEYKGIEVEETSAEVSEEDIAAELKRLQERHAEVVVLDDGKAEQGDITSIDFEGFVDGVPFEGGKAEKYSLEIGSNSFIPGFEDQIVGMELGEEREINVTFPEQYHSEELKGKAAVFKVKLQELRRKNLPELDDEFAKDVSEFDTLEEFKQDIVDRLKKQKQDEQKRTRETEVVEKAAAAATVDVPEVMVENEVEHMLRDFENRLRMQGMNLELYYQFSGQSEDSMREQMRSDARTRVLNNLVLEAIVAAEKIEVSEEEVAEELQTLADRYQRPVEELREAYEVNGTLESLKENLGIRKAIDFLVENSKVKSGAA
ncbi:MAG: trigger factor [Paenibacillaceae bacterium]|jgi:trigger factor|nr:trigger factor [Paenibacillaceae bacterium]